MCEIYKATHYLRNHFPSKIEAIVSQMVLRFLNFESFKLNSTEFTFKSA